MNQNSQSPHEPKPHADLTAEEVRRQFWSKSEPTSADYCAQRRRNRGFRDFVAWQRAMQLVFEIYGLTAGFPAAERLGLSSQMKRAAVSCASNISEGYGRASTGEFRQFLGHARGSSAELETQLLIAKHLGFGSADSIERATKLTGEVGRLLTSLMRSLKA